MVSYPSGVNYLNAYFRAVHAIMLDRGMTNTLMLSDTYAGPRFVPNWIPLLSNADIFVRPDRYWAPYWPADANIVFDSHICKT